MVLYVTPVVVSMVVLAVHGAALSTVCGTALGAVHGATLSATRGASEVQTLR